MDVVVEVPFLGNSHKSDVVVESEIVIIGMKKDSLDESDLFVAFRHTKLMVTGANDYAVDAIAGRVWDQITSRV